MKPIQVISLAQNNELRRDHMQQEFAKHGIAEFEFFDAITRDQVADVLESWQLSLRPPTGIYEPLTGGEMGCLLSHIALWRRMVQENIPYLFILEDDVFLGENFKRLLNVDYLPKNTSVLKLETIRLNRFIRLGRKSIASVEDRQIHTLTETHTGSAAYLITLSGAKYLLKRLHDMPIRQVDRFLFEDLFLDHQSSADYHVFQMTPAPCVQEMILTGEGASSRLSSSISAEMQERCEKERLKLHTKKKLTLFQKIVREIKCAKYALQTVKCTIPFK